MSEPKFTKGPWSVDQGYIVQEEFCGIVKDSFGHIAFVAGYQDEDFSNAHLISAAPELYDALSDLLYVIGGETDAVRKRCADERAKAKAALAKARGEKP